MKKHFLIGMAIGCISLGIDAQKLTKVWETDTVFSVPESVLFADSVLYVSNVNGKPTEKNGLGYISKISLSGEVIVDKWATGIHAPKGMGAYDGHLYVSDIDRILVVNVASGQVVNEILFQEADFLNDIAVSSSGKVYISDMKKNTIYVIDGDKSMKFITDDQLSYVNGLYCEEEELFAGTANGVFKLNSKGEIEKLYIKDTGGIDGLEKTGNGTFLISDWSGKVHLISPDNDPVLLLHFESDKYNAADIGFNDKEKIMYLPTFFGNTVAAYRLEQ